MKVPSFLPGDETLKKKKKPFFASFHNPNSGRWLKRSLWKPLGGLTRPRCTVQGGDGCRAQAAVT